MATYYKMYEKYDWVEDASSLPKDEFITIAGVQIESHFASTSFQDGVIGNPVGFNLVRFIGLHPAPVPDDQKGFSDGPLGTYYSYVTVQIPDGAFIDPAYLVGGSASPYLEDLGYEIEARWASISWQDLRATGDISFNFGAAFQLIAIEAAERAGFGSVVNSLLRVDEVRSAMQSHMNGTIELIEYGIDNFENADSKDYDGLVSAHLRKSYLDFLDLAEANLGTSRNATKFLDTAIMMADLSSGRTDIEISYGRKHDLIGNGLVLVGGEVSVVLGGNERDHIVNQGNSEGATASAGQGSYWGISPTRQFDYFDLKNGRDVFLGSDTDEFIEAGKGNDDLRGLNGNDLLSGGRGRDTIYGGSGQDLIAGGRGSDKIFGGNGQSDVVDYSSSNKAIEIELSRGRGWGGDAAGDKIQGVEWIIGSSFSDVISGDGGENYFFGGGQDDKIYGKGGGDTLSGGKGDDQIWGLKGDDWIAGNRGKDILVGGEGFDIALFADRNKPVKVDLAEQSDATSWLLTPPNKDDRQSGTVLSGFEGLVGSLSHDRLKGDDSSNVLDGLRGDDLMNGRDGDDSLWGGNGEDTLRGGWGEDVLRGGKGRDTFLFVADDVGELTTPNGYLVSHTDSIYDFEPGKDIIRIEGFDADASDLFIVETYGIGLPIVGAETDIHTEISLMGVNGLDIWIKGTPGVTISDFVFD